jgi:uncharacterized protein (AIM24 family)
MAVPEFLLTSPSGLLIEWILPPVPGPGQVIVTGPGQVITMDRRPGQVITINIGSGAVLVVSDDLLPKKG